MTLRNTRVKHPREVLFAQLHVPRDLAEREWLRKIAAQKFLGLIDHKGLARPGGFGDGGAFMEAPGHVDEEVGAERTHAMPDAGPVFFRFASDCPHDFLHRRVLCLRQMPDLGEVMLDEGSEIGLGVAPDSDFCRRVPRGGERRNVKGNFQDVDARPVAGFDFAIVLPARPRHHADVAGVHWENPRAFALLHAVRLKKKQQLHLRFAHQQFAAARNDEAQLRHTDEGPSEPLDGRKGHGQCCRCAGRNCQETGQPEDSVHAAFHFPRKWQCSCAEKLA